MANNATPDLESNRLGILKWEKAKITVVSSILSLASPLFITFEDVVYWHIYIIMPRFDKGVQFACFYMSKHHQEEIDVINQQNFSIFFGIQFFVVVVSVFYNSRRVRHDLATELNWTEDKVKSTLTQISFNILNTEIENSIDEFLKFSLLSAHDSSYFIECYPVQ